MANPTDIGPLDHRVSIVDKQGKPSPEFQRRWNSNRANTALITGTTFGTGAPTATPSGDGQKYFDTSVNPYRAYVSYSGVYAPASPIGGTPSALASDTATVGTATTFMRSDASPAIQKASATQFGLVKVDGLTIASASGIISVPTATTSVLGLVKPDGTTITITTGGVITAVGGGGGGGGLSVPLTTPDLIYCWDSASISLKASSGYPLMSMTNACPWNKDFTFYPATAGAGATVDPTTLAGYPVALGPGNTNGRYTANLPSSFTMTKATVFAVVNPASFSGTADLVCGNSGSLEVRFDASGHIQLLKTFVIGIGTATTAISTGAWSQVNATYDDSTGAYAFRVGKSAAGSGSNAQTITAPWSSLFYNPPGGSGDYSGKLAFLAVYNRVLSASEISAIEAYLTSTYGV